MLKLQFNPFTAISSTLNRSSKEEIIKLAMTALRTRKRVGHLSEMTMTLSLSRRYKTGRLWLRVGHREGASVLVMLWRCQ